MIKKEIKERLTFPNHKIITVDEYNWLCEQMEIVKKHLESTKKDLPIKIK